MIVVNELYKFQKILFVAWRGGGVGVGGDIV